ncbi:hypothetical protein BDQ17DRAFT_1429759 [Cyathus striatus]|nr:hypothetical protein BDQ17DRAFT_1429759 [Cyathus striatus]
MSDIPLLFQPTKVGRLNLSHRVIHAPLNRFRNFKYTHIPHTALMKEYYTQRASTPGTLIIAEAALISPEGAGMPNGPGIWSEGQLEAWKEIVESVHSKGSYIYVQLVAIGRAASLLGIQSDNLSLSGPSPIPLSTQPQPIPHELTIPQIHAFTKQFANAAKMAIEQAGFDGIEIHGAYGYLIDHVQGRSKFPLEIVRAIVAAIGVDKVGLRISPWSTFNEMGMSNPIPQFTHFIQALKESHPNLAYLHIVEPRLDPENGIQVVHTDSSNDFIRDIWAPKVLITAGGYDRDSAIRDAERGELVSFGRWFIANPDLPRRLKENLPLNKYDRKTFYVPIEDPKPEVGYIDYPFYKGGGSGEKDKYIFRGLYLVEELD